MKAVYIAHPLGSGEDREKNRQNATQWCAYLAARYCVAPLADWIVLSGVWSEAHRDMGMAIDFELIRRADEVWLCGGRISPGMYEEMLLAKSLGKRTVDLTGFGYAAPTTGSDEMDRAVELMAMRLVTKLGES